MNNRELLAWIDEEIKHGDLGSGWHHVWRADALTAIRALIRTAPEPEKVKRLVEAANDVAVVVAEFMRDWHKGDFALPKLAESDAAAIDMPLCRLTAALAEVEKDGGK